jgi:hypothetical protein
MFEDALRETFTAQVTQLPSVADSAGTAIVRARRIRRRRRITVGGVLAVAVVLATGALVQFGPGADRGRPQPAHSPTVRPSASPSPVVDGVDGLNGSKLTTAGGRTFALTGGKVTSVSAVPSGWIYSTDTHQVFLLGLDGAVTDARIATDRLVVSPDGGRVVWRQYGTSTLVTGVLRPDRIEQAAKLDVNGDVGPVTFAGDRVVLEMNGGAYPKYGVWTPGQGVSPNWTDQVSEIIGLSTGGAVGAAYQDGSRLRPCLADFGFDASGIHVLHTACELPDLAWPSPDSRWLAASTARGEELFDLSTVFSQAPAGVTCPAPINPGYVFWVGSHLYYPVASGGGWIRCGTDGTSTPYSFGGGDGVRRDGPP